MSPYECVADIVFLSGTDEICLSTSGFPYERIVIDNNCLAFLSAVTIKTMSLVTSPIKMVIPCGILILSELDRSKRGSN